MLPRHFGNINGFGTINEFFFSRRNPARGPSAQTTAAEKSTKSRAIQPHGGRRLGREGGSASCAAPRRSLKSKGSPSTLAVCARGRERRLAARARAAAKDSKADQRVTYAAVALERRSGGAARARLRARSRMNCAASVLQRPPAK